MSRLGNFLTLEKLKCKTKYIQQDVSNQNNQDITNRYLSDFSRVKEKVSGIPGYTFFLFQTFRLKPASHLKWLKTELEVRRETQVPILILMLTVVWQCKSHFNSLRFRDNNIQFMLKALCNDLSMLCKGELLHYYYYLLLFLSLKGNYHGKKKKP